MGGRRWLAPISNIHYPITRNPTTTYTHRKGDFTMNATLTVAIISMIAALTFYTIGVWSEKIQGVLKPWHLAFFWLGLVFDTLGTNRMFHIAGGVQLDVHGVTGLIAITLMFIHAMWASWVLYKKDENAARNFHKFSIMVWVIWLIPFVSGLALAMF